MSYRDLGAIAVAALALLLASAAWVADAPGPAQAGLAPTAVLQEAPPQDIRPAGRQLAAADTGFDRWLDRLTEGDGR